MSLVPEIVNLLAMNAVVSRERRYAAVLALQYERANGSLMG